MPIAGLSRRAGRNSAAARPATVAIRFDDQCERPRRTRAGSDGRRRRARVERRPLRAMDRRAIGRRRQIQPLAEEDREERRHRRGCGVATGNAAADDATRGQVRAVAGLAWDFQCLRRALRTADDVSEEVEERRRCHCPVDETGDQRVEAKRDGGHQANPAAPSPPCQCHRRPPSPARFHSTPEPGQERMPAAAKSSDMREQQEALNFPFIAALENAASVLDQARQAAASAKDPKPRLPPRSR